jgi:hypothetical protein
MRTRVQLSYTVLALLIGGCASVPGEPVSEKLDPVTATTVTVINQPVELLSQTTHGVKADPFAYIAPFETDRMGKRDLFLWVAAPQDVGSLTRPQVLCNGEPLRLEPLDKDALANGPAVAPTTADTKAADAANQAELAGIKLAHAPYDAPVPWSAQWYFRLPPEGLKCLAGAEAVSLETHFSNGEAERFTTDRKNLASLDAFARR